ncbi:MAG: deoxyribonuclease IV, partial [Nitrospirae bacterium]|nr:deoxyribonuclease IV [Nitrospirota bacterium]
EDLRRKSIEAFHEEMERVERLGLPYLIMHPGAHMGAGEEAGLGRVAAAFDEVHERTRGLRMRILIETTAGQGTTLGYRFAQIRRMLDLVREPERLGVCLDTCHVFAAGYDIRTSEGWNRTMEEFDRVVGFERLKAIHMNDSARPMGSRVDRHAHIGKGHIGLEPFRAIMNEPRLAGIPKIIETPKEGGHERDRQNLATLKNLADAEGAGPDRESGKKAPPVKSPGT